MNSSNFETQEEIEDELERRLKKIASLLPDTFHSRGVGMSRYGKIIGRIECTEKDVFDSLNIGRSWIEGVSLPDSMSYPDDDEWVVTPMGLDLPEDIIYVRILDVSPEEAASQIKEKILDGLEDL